MREPADEGRTLVVGYGNPFCGDDAVGWAVADAVAKHADPRRVHAVAVHQLTPEVAAKVAAASHVVFVDAAVGPDAGAVRCSPVTAPASAPAVLLHHMDPGEVMALAARLYGARPPADMVTIVGADFSHGRHLSPAVAASVDAAATLVLRIAAGGNA